MRKMILAMFCLSLSVSAHAADATITVSGAWLRASLGQTPTTAGYLMIENKGKQDDKLLNVTMPGASMAHVHETTMKDGVMQMKAVDALTIKPGESVELKPGGLHIMVMGLKAPLKPGDPVTLDLQFEKAGHITVDAKVRGIERAQ